MLPVPDKLEAESEQEMKLAIHFGQTVRTNVLRAIDISQMPDVLFLIVRGWLCDLSEMGDEYEQLRSHGAHKTAVVI
jgi:hypothetical protein